MTVEDCLPFSLYSTETVCKDKEGDPRYVFPGRGKTGSCAGFYDGNECVLNRIGPRHNRNQ